MAKPTKTSGEDIINIRIGSKGILTKMQITIELKSVCGTTRGFPVDDNAQMFTRLTRSRTLDESDIETIQNLGFEVLVKGETEVSKLNTVIAEVRRILPLCGFTEDAYGHYQKISNGKTKEGTIVPVKLRVKMQQTSCRVEKQVVRSDGSKEWMRVGGEYFSNCQIDGNSVTIGRITFKPEGTDD